MTSFDRQVPACILQYQHMIHELHGGKFEIDRSKAQRLGPGINFIQYEISFGMFFVYVSMLVLDFSRRISLLSSMILGT